MIQDSTDIPEPTASFYIVIHRGRVLGRHRLLDPIPPWKAAWMVRRFYPDFPQASLTRDPDQESTATGRFAPPDVYRATGNLRTMMRAALRKGTKEQIIAILNELAP